MDGVIVGTLGKRRRMRTLVRPRPLKDDENGAAWAFDDRSISEQGTNAPPPPASGMALHPPPAMFLSVYKFDRVFQTQAGNYEVYDDAAKGIVKRVCEGYNGTLFVFGNTSSGKTHTAMGSSADPGLIVWAINDVFAFIGNSSGREFLLRVSFFEIHSESVKDLLKPGAADELQVYEDPVRGYGVAGLSEQVVGSAEQIMELLVFGEANRHVATLTKRSRSHTVLKLLIDSDVVGGRTNDSDFDGEAGGAKCVPLLSSALHLVDLAGSEGTYRERGSSAPSGCVEPMLINRSLRQLQVVVGALAKGARGRNQVPYHESVLTQLLGDSLGGDSDAVMVCTIAICKAQQITTRRSLQFANRCMVVENAPTKQIVVDGQSMLPTWRAEMKALEVQVATAEQLAQVETALLKGPETDDLPSMGSHAEMVLSSVKIAHRETELEGLGDKLDEMSKFLLVADSVSQYDQAYGALAAGVAHLGDAFRQHRFLSPDMLRTLDMLKDMSTVEQFWKHAPDEAKAEMGEMGGGVIGGGGGAQGHLIFILNKSLLQAKEQSRVLRAALLEQEEELDEARSMLEAELDRNPVRRLASPAKAMRRDAPEPDSKPSTPDGRTMRERIGAHKRGASGNVAALLSPGTNNLLSPGGGTKALRRKSVSADFGSAANPNLQRALSTGPRRRNSGVGRRPSLALDAPLPIATSAEHAKAIDALVEKCTGPETQLEATIYTGDGNCATITVYPDTVPSERAAEVIAHHGLEPQMVESLSAQISEALVETLRRELKRSRTHTKKSVDLLKNTPKDPGVDGGHLAFLGSQLEQVKAEASAAQEELSFIVKRKLEPMQEERDLLQAEVQQLNEQLAAEVTKATSAMNECRESEDQVKALEAMVFRYSREAGRSGDAAQIKEAKLESRRQRRRVAQLESLLLAKEDHVRMMQAKLVTNTAGNAEFPVPPPRSPVAAMPPTPTQTSVAASPSNQLPVGKPKSAANGGAAGLYAGSGAPNETMTHMTGSGAPATTVSTDVPPPPSLPQYGDYVPPPPGPPPPLPGDDDDAPAPPPPPDSPPPFREGQQPNTPAAKIHVRKSSLARLFGTATGRVGNSSPTHPVRALGSSTTPDEATAPKLLLGPQNTPVSHAMRCMFDHFSKDGVLLSMFQLRTICKQAGVTGSAAGNMSAVTNGEVGVVFSAAVRGTGKQGLDFKQFTVAMEKLALKRFARLFNKQRAGRSDALDLLSNNILAPFVEEMGLGEGQLREIFLACPPRTLMPLLSLSLTAAATTGEQ